MSERTGNAWSSAARWWVAVAAVTAVTIGLTAPTALANHQDFDGDGHTGADDCAPLDPAVHKGAPDPPELSFEDSNCDGIDGDRASSVFVSTHATNDQNPGTPAAPMRSIAEAVREADGGWVLVAAGEYHESVSVPSGAKIAGGYEPGAWTRPSRKETTITGSPQAVFAEDANGVVLQLLTLHGTRGAAHSAYGLRAVNSSVALVGSRVSAGPGGPGAAGPPQTGFLEAAANGFGGELSIIGDVGAGGAGGASGPGGDGGRGGDGAVNAESAPSAGQNGGQGDGAGGGGGLPNGPNGRDGVSGSGGGNGSGGSDSLGDANAEWRGKAGLPGRPGGNGGGGGGGAGGPGAKACLHIAGGSICFPVPGAGGGGGGEGGTGGLGGLGGGPGGGSFGVYLWNSALVTTASTISAGEGGPGGAGGAGGEGGPGGSGGQGGQRCDFNSCTVTAGAGGRGGNGGRGGPGGGGAGGPSAAIFRGVSSLATVKTTQLSHGDGGAGGAAAMPGEKGRSAQVLGEGGVGSGDFDGDGKPDGSDECPDVQGFAAANGCPDRPPRLADGDGDQIPDGRDGCPSQAARPDVNEDGCTDPDFSKDTDLDGVADIRDRCPARAGGPFDTDADGCPGPYLPISPASPTLSVKLLKRGVRVVSFGTIAPRNARVVLRCVKRCGKRKVREVFSPSAADGASRTVSSRRLKRRKLPFGARLTVTITRPGTIGFHRRYTTMRRPPGAKKVDLCIPEGSSRPASSCPV